MAHWNTPPITAAERDRAGLETLRIVDALDPSSTRRFVLRAEVAALLLVGILFETGAEADDKYANADETINYLLTRIREFIREAGDVIDQ